MIPEGVKSCVKGLQLEAGRRRLRIVYFSNDREGEKRQRWLRREKKSSRREAVW